MKSNLFAGALEIFPSEAARNGSSSTKGDGIDRRNRANKEQKADGANISAESNRVPVLIETVVHKSTRNGADEPYLMIPKQEIEDKANMKLEIGATYSIEAKVNDSLELSVRRIITENRYVRFYPQKEERSELKSGERCVVAITSIERVSEMVYRGSQNAKVGRERHLQEGRTVRTGGSNETQSDSLGHYEATYKAYQRPGDDSRIAFRLWKPSIERENGMKFERGKVYDIEGSIGNVCRFNTWHTERGRANYISIHVPKESLERVRPGERYSIRLDSIRERLQHPLEMGGEVSSVWDWKMVAAWIDTEGTYHGRGNGSFCVTVSQKERGPLEGIRRFLAREGIDSAIRKDPHGDSYYLQTKGGMESLARIIVATKPYITTENKKAQIEAFETELMRTKKIENYHRKNARLILGLGVSSDKD